MSATWTRDDRRHSFQMIPALVIEILQGEEINNKQAHAQTFPGLSLTNERFILKLPQKNYSNTDAEANLYSATSHSRF